jgi:hypothetical protein
MSYTLPEGKYQKGGHDILKVTVYRCKTKMKEREIKIFEVLACVFFILFALFFLYQAFASKTISASKEGELQPMDAPKTVLIGMSIFAGIILFFALKWYMVNGFKGKTKLDIFTVKTILTFVYILVYALLWNLIGFILCTFIFFVAESKTLEPSRSWKQVLLVSFIFTVGCVLLFRQLFYISFPEPLLDLIVH